MPGTRHMPAGRLRLALGAAVLVPALVGMPAGAAPNALATQVAAAAAPARAASVQAVPGQGTPAAGVRQPTVTTVALKGVNKSVLAAAPSPNKHEHGTVGALAVEVPVKPAAAASVRIKKPASLVAVTADAAFPAGTSVQVRVKEKSGWSRWTTLHVDPEHGPDPGTPEARGARPGTDPLMTVDARRAQVRIDTPSGRLPKGTELTLVNAPSAPSDLRSSRVSAQATVGQPPIVTRAQWGADESLRSRAPIYTSTVSAGFVHHTASTSNYSAAQAAAQVRAIYAYHTKSLNHSDIDYNFLVDRFGRLYEGRAGGMNLPVMGAHTAGFNDNTFAVSALGNFETFAPSAGDMASIKDSIARLFAWKLGLHGVNPAATVKLVSAGYIKATRYPKGSVATISATSSHQTVNYTSCPGKHLQAQLSSIRGMGAAYSDVVISAPSPAAQTIGSGERADFTFTSAANRAVTWTADILSPCSDTPVRSYAGATAGPGPISVTWDLKDTGGAPVLPATYTIRMTGSASDGTPVATVASDLTIAPAPGGAWGPCANASRVAGATPAATSVLWGRISAPSSAAVVLTGPADAGTASLAAGVAAAPLARSIGAPLLITPAGSLAAEVAADIQARRGEVIIVGGPGVVSDATAAAVAALGVPVTRLAGATDAATAVAVAARMAPAASVVLVSPEGSPAHTLAGSALAAARGVPVLFAGPTSVPAETVAALAGRPVSVVAPVALPDSAIPAPVTERLTGADAISSALAVGAAFPATAESAMVLPESPQGWASAPVAAAAGVPLLFTPSPVLSAELAAFITARPALRATTTTVPASQLSDQVLGATSRVLLGLPWAPPGVGGPQPAAGPTATNVLKVGKANASPEPVKKGRKVKVTSKVTARFTDKKYRSAPAGVAFTVQFKPSGAKKYKAIASGRTTAGRATATVKATKSGRYRIVVGSKRSGSDYLRVKK